MSMAETLTRTAKKQQVKIGKTTTLHVHHLFFFCTFRSLPSLHDMPNLRRDKNKKAARQRFSFPFPELRTLRAETTFLRYELACEK